LCENKKIIFKNLKSGFGKTVLSAELPSGIRFYIVPPKNKLREKSTLLASTFFVAKKIK